MAKAVPSLEDEAVSELPNGTTRRGNVSVVLVRRCRRDHVHVRGGKLQSVKYPILTRGFLLPLLR